MRAAWRGPRQRWPVHANPAEINRCMLPPVSNHLFLSRDDKLDRRAIDPPLRSWRSMIASPSREHCASSGVRSCMVDSGDDDGIDCAGRGSLRVPQGAATTTKIFAGRRRRGEEPGCICKQEGACPHENAAQAAWPDRRRRCFARRRRCSPLNSADPHRFERPVEPGLRRQRAATARTGFSSWSRAGSFACCSRARRRRPPSSTSARSSRRRR